MDGQHARQHGHQVRRGGGRGHGTGHGNVTRSMGSTQVYRRVVHTEDDVPIVRREEGESAPVRPAFKSSLQLSLQNTPPTEGNGRESRRSPRKVENAGGRHDSSSQKRQGKEEDEQPKRFTSSLARSISSQDARYADAGSNGGRGGGRGGSSRSGSRDSRAGGPSGRDHPRRGDHESSHRRVEISHSGAEHRPFTSSLATRKQSFESDTSERSARSVHRRELEASHRRVEIQRDTRGDHRPYKSSLNGGTRPSRAGSIESDTSERSVRSTSSSRSRWDTKSRGDYGLRRSIDDGRRVDRGMHSKISEERSVPPVCDFERSTSDHSVASNSSQRTPSSLASSLRGSSLASSVSRQDVRSAPAPVTVAKPLAKSAQDARVNSTSNSSTTWKSSLKRSLDTTTEAPPSKSSPTDKSPGFKSSLTASVSADTSATANQSTDEQERKRIAAERLRERMEASQQARGTSLSQLLEKNPVDTSRNDKPIRSESSSLRDSRQPSILSRVGDKAPIQSDKESRSREFFTKLQNEDNKREMARRAAAPLQSSLLSSLARREAPSASVKKLIYTLDQLRKLKSSPEIRPPTDLQDMTIAEVIEFRPRTQVGNGSSLGGRRVEASSKRGGSKRGGLSKPSNRAVPPPKKERQRGGGGGRRGGPPPPPLYDGPIEPLQLSENRWVPKKAEKSVLESTISRVKSVLNKLTREKFKKLTDELCETDIQSLEMLNSIIAVIMDKAIEEPSFADVYADLCKEFHVRTLAMPWNFLRAAKSRTKSNVYSWTTIRLDDTNGFVGPFASENECVHAATESASDSTSTTDQDISKATLFVTEKDLIAIVKARQSSYFYKKKALVTLTENEPILGEYDSTDAAIQAGMKQTSFKKLLVTRCQFEFEKFNKSSQAPADDEENLDARQKELNAMRLKRKMLGNIRFIGELFKTDLLNQSVVKACLFHLLGLELVQGTNDGQLAGQEVRFPDEEDIEALCKLLATVGKKYDQPKTQTIMRIVILRLVELSEEKKLPSRSRFLLKDVLEMRDHLWEPRRKELQQKTLEEVRREAKQLQSQGKNAQHDNINKRRLKSQVSSIQLAKESSNLLVRKDTMAETAQSNETEPSPQPSTSETSLTDPAKIETRIKSIIQEYSSIHDIDEAATCVRELPSQSLPDFAEHIVNRALEGKDQERHDVVELLVKLYECGAVDATSIQLALVNVMEFLDDIKIDIPLAHQYSALVFGRLIAAGCFGLSWMVKEALHHLVDTGMTSLVFAEALHVIEADSDERTVVRMIGDEELSATSVLPKSVRRDDAAVSKFIEEHELEIYFGIERPHDEDDDESDSDIEDGDFELDPETEHKMRSTLEEYLSVKDLGEVVLCVKELGGEDTSFFLWRHFIRVCVLYSLEAKQAVRLEVADLICRLVIECTDDVDVTDVEEAFEAVLADYEDVRVDVPRLADNFAELWTPLFEKPDCMTLEWLHEAVAHLIPTGDAAEVLSSFLTRFDSLFGREKLVQWWQEQEQQHQSVQPDSASWLATFSSVDGKTTGVHERLVAWEQSLQGSP